MTNRPFYKEAMTSLDSTLPREGSHYWDRTASPLLSAEVWGVQLERRTPFDAASPHPTHVTTELLGTPEGLLLIARCTACGGRQEGLLDFRDLPSLGRDSVPAAMDTIEQAAYAAAARWSERHTDCVVTPIVHHVPVQVEHVLRAQLDAAIADVRAGEPLANELLVLMSDRSILLLPLAGLPHGPASDPVRDRTIAFHAVHATAREHTRRTGVRPLAAVVVSSACLSKDNEGYRKCEEDDELHQEELLTVLVATPEAMVLAIAPITRELGLAGVGPGEVGPLTFDSVKVACPLVDGLFATSCQP